nr:AAA family ATPase [uncultured Carboxylicivirga sp.]
MKIKKIHIENYRGFEELDFSLSYRKNNKASEYGEYYSKEMLAVFIGDNGSGKTSILNAIRWALKNITSKFFPDAEKEKLSYRDLKIGASETTINLELENGLDTSVNDIMSPQTYNLNYYKQFQRDHPEFHHVAGDIQRITDDIQANSFDPDGSVPIFAFYSSDRSFDDNIRIKHITQNKLLQTYANTLEAKTKFVDFENWFIVEQSDENSTRLEKGNLEFKKGTVECVRQALISFLNYLDVDSFGNISVGKSPFIEHDEGLVMLIEKNGVKIPVKHLSDGERILIHLVGDIARRCVIASHDSNQFSYTNSTGIVLIDEIDIHLHPKWQINIIRALQSTFPGIQFLVTTHSPLVLSRVPNKCVHRIDNFKLFSDNIYTKGRKPEYIMYSEQGVKIREDSIQQEIDKFYQLIESKEGLTEAKNILNDLFMAQFGEHDPDTVKATRDYEFALMEFEED